MQDHSKNIYKIHRMKANLTQEAAAELIPVSVESIRAYETGVTVPPDDTVCRMVVVYDADCLAYQHLINRSEVARRIIPDINIISLPQAICSIKKELNDVVAQMDDLFTIGCDGKVTADERETFDRILSELFDFVKSVIELKYAKEE